MRKIIAYLLLCAMLAACLTGIAEEPKQITAPQDAEIFVRVLLSDTPEALEGVYALTDQVAQAVKTLGGFGGLAKSLAVLGEAQEIGSAFAAEFAGKPAFRVPCRFALMPADIVLVLENNALAGLSTAPYTEPKEAAAPEDAAAREIDLALPIPGLGELPGTLTLRMETKEKSGLPSRLFARIAMRAVQLIKLEIEVAMAMPMGLSSGGRIQMKNRFIARLSATPIVPTMIGFFVSLRA